MKAELRRRFLGLCAGVAVSGLVAACGGNSTTGDSAGSAIDPCSLITADEAGKALGVNVGAPERPPEANRPPALVTCRYAGSRDQGVAVMTVMVRQSDSAGTARAGFQSLQRQFQDIQAVDGVGDEAFFLGNQLNVLKGATHLNITGDFDQATAAALGRQAASRLR
jgi:hypothetical protein